MFCAMYSLYTKNNWRLSDLPVTQPCWTLLCAKMEFSSQKFFLVKSWLDEVGGKGMSPHLNFVTVLRLQKQQYLEEHVERFDFSSISPSLMIWKRTWQIIQFLCRFPTHGRGWSEMSVKDPSSHAGVLWLSSVTSGACKTAFPPSGMDFPHCSTHPLLTIPLGTIIFIPSTLSSWIAQIFSAVSKS